MKNVSDLLKSESFRENQLYPFLISKFKIGTIPTDINEFLDCFSYDKENQSLSFCCKFGEFEHEKIQVLLGTSKAYFCDWSVSHLADKRDIYTFDFDYLKIVIQQLDCIDRINRLISIAGTFEISQVSASVLWDGGSQVERIKSKYEELEHVAQKRISQLENQERKEQEEYIL